MSYHGNTTVYINICIGERGLRTAACIVCSWLCDTHIAFWRGLGVCPPEKLTSEYAS